MSNWYVGDNSEFLNLLLLLLFHWMVDVALQQTAILQTSEKWRYKNNLFDIYICKSYFRKRSCSRQIRQKNLNMTRWPFYFILFFYPTPLLGLSLLFHLNLFRLFVVLLPLAQWPPYGISIGSMKTILTK